MSSIAVQEIRRFGRRVGTALFLGGFLRGLSVLALAATGIMLLARIVGVPVQPAPWWTALLVLPTAWGILRARRLGFGAGDSAAHIDRRLELGGLLITATELATTESWQPRLDERLRVARDALPELRWQRLLLHPAAAVLLAAAVALLPPPQSAMGPAAVHPVIAEQLTELADELEVTVEEGLLEEDEATELRQRLEDLQAELAGGEVPEWSDVDGLRDRLAHEKTEQAARLQRAAAGLAALADGAVRRSDEPTATADQELAAAFAQAVADAGAAGLLDGLPPELLARLAELQGEGGAIDPAALSMSAEELQGLAAALAQAAQGALGELDLASLLDAGQLADLRELLAQQGLGQMDAELGHTHGPG